MPDLTPAKKFYWGASTSSHQVEGNTHNDWTEWERKNADRLAEGAHLKFGWLGKIWERVRVQAEHPENYLSGSACDHYRRFKDDFDMARSLGHNAHRFSLEWSRIEPEEGKFDEKEIEHYRDVIKALRERGMEPFVTLWHWTLPLWVRNQGGWENKKTIQDFVLYAEKIVELLGEHITFWIPLNEPSVYIGLGYVMGKFPPEVKDYRKANAVLKNLIEAHKLTYALIHKKFGERVSVGNAYNLHWHVPARSWNIFDILVVQVIDYIRDSRPISLAKGHQDFIGVNYYFRDKVKFVGWGGKFGPVDAVNTNAHVSDIGWDIAPEGLYHTLKKAAKFGKPIYITENGIADAKDRQRAEFIKDHLKWLYKAIEEGADVRGYFHWSLLDNFEWAEGFTMKFGLVEMDFETLERKPRNSYYLYKEICEKNGL